MSLAKNIFSTTARCCAAAACATLVWAPCGAWAQEQDVGVGQESVVVAMGRSSGPGEGSQTETGAVPALERGLASWYGAQLHRRRTASGEPYDMHALTAAHPWLPFGSQVCVRSLVTGKAVAVRINDRGPRGANRIIDLSRAAAQALGMLGRGTKPVALTALQHPRQECS